MNNEAMTLDLLEELESMEKIGWQVTVFEHEGLYFIYNMDLYPSHGHKDNEILQKYNAMNQELYVELVGRFELSMPLVFSEDRSMQDLLSELNLNTETKSQNGLVW